MLVSSAHAGNPVIVPPHDAIGAANATSAPCGDPVPVDSWKVCLLPDANAVVDWPDQSTNVWGSPKSFILTKPGLFATFLGEQRTEIGRPLIWYDVGSGIPVAAPSVGYQFPLAGKYAWECLVCSGVERQKLQGTMYVIGPRALVKPNLLSPGNSGTSITYDFDASGSFVTDYTAHTIVEYAFDFQDDGVFDQLGPQSTGQATLTRGPHTVRIRVQDDVGRTASSLAQVGVPDLSAPQITITAPVDGARFRQGQVVLADYICTDADGPTDVKFCTSPVADGAAIDTSTAGTKSFTVNAQDKAGNPATKSVQYVVDASAPDITIASPVQGGRFRQGQVVLADFACIDADGLPDVKTCAGTTADGAAINTNTPGAKSLTVNAEDQAGNTSSKTVSYVVDATAPQITVSVPGDMPERAVARWPLVGFALQRVRNAGSTFGVLRAVVASVPRGGSLVVTCPTACGARTGKVIATLRGTGRSRTVALKRALPIGRATTIRVALVVPGKVGRFKTYGFRPGRFAPRSTTKRQGCLQPANRTRLTPCT